MTIALDCTTDLEAKLNTIPAVADKAVMVYSESDLLAKAKSRQPPFIGIVYEGIRSVGDGSNQGLSSEMVFALLVIMPEKGLLSASTKADVITILDAMRGVVRTTKSPTGHKWKFDAELPAKEVNGNLVWFQRWSTAVII